MPSTFIVNKMTAVHASSGGMTIIFPDVCQVPTAVGPIPIPMPNIAMSSDAADTAGTVKADGEAIMVASSNFSTSTGDEAGSVGGVVSSKIKGKASPMLYSFDVKADGEGVFRLADMMLQNEGAAPNTPPGTEVQAPAMAMGASLNAAAAEGKPPKITSVKVTPAKVCCGDEVTIDVETENYPDGAGVGLVAIDGALRMGLPPSAQPVISGDKGSSTWVVRRGAYREAAEFTIRATGVGGPCDAASALEVAAPTKASDVKQGTIAKYAQIWLQLPSGPYLHRMSDRPFETNFVYEISVQDGEIVVERDVELVARGLSITEDEKQAWKEQIEDRWDNKFRVHRVSCQRGNDCDCQAHGCCSWPIRVRVHWRRGMGKPVVVLPGARRRNDPNWSSHLWWQNDRGFARPHEFGHLLGLYDEYGETGPPAGLAEGRLSPRKSLERSTRDHSRTWTDMTAGNGLMHSGGVAYARYYEAFAEWFDEKFRSEVGPTKLLPLAGGTDE